jgi:hypothetical protein
MSVHWQKDDNGNRLFMWIALYPPLRKAVCWVVGHSTDEFGMCEVCGSYEEKQS